MPAEPRGLELPLVAECRLDLDGLRAQRERYRGLGERVAGMEREPLSFAIQFDPAVDAALVAETVAVERDCCPFFELRFDAEARRLTVSVREPEQAPALDALLFALGRD
jgi:hypothetical protein